MLSHDAIFILEILEILKKRENQRFFHFFRSPIGGKTGTFEVSMRTTKTPKIKKRPLTLTGARSGAALGVTINQSPRR